MAPPAPLLKEKQGGDISDKNDETDSATTTPVVLITGCSSGGIGFELARALARSGKARVIATARDVSKASELEGERNVVALVPLDVTDDESVAAAARRVAELTGGRGCDVLVNNAGVTFKGTQLDADVAATAKLFDCNVMGVLRATKAFTTTGMVRRGRGLIANVGSATGYIYQSTKSAYSASKHAVKCLTDSLRVELSPFNVRVVLVSPGFVATPIDDKSGAQGRWFAPVPGVSPYAPLPPSASSSSSSSASDNNDVGFRQINVATRTSIFKSGVGAGGSMSPAVFSMKLADALLREWSRTSPAKGTVTRPPTIREYLFSSAWLPTALGGPLRHYRDAPFGTFCWVVGGFLPLWLQDLLMSLGGGLIERTW